MSRSVRIARNGVQWRSTILAAGLTVSMTDEEADRLVAHGDATEVNSGVPDPLVIDSLHVTGASTLDGPVVLEGPGTGASRSLSSTVFHSGDPESPESAPFLHQHETFIFAPTYLPDAFPDGAVNTYDTTLSLTAGFATLLSTYDFLDNASGVHTPGSFAFVKSIAIDYGNNNSEALFSSELQTEAQAAAVGGEVAWQQPETNTYWQWGTQTPDGGFYMQGGANFNGFVISSTTNIVSFDVGVISPMFTPTNPPLLATGADHTVDDVITALQTIGLVRQS